MARIQARPDPLLENRRLLADFKEGKPSALTRLYTEYLADIVGFLKRGFSFNAGGFQFAFRGYKEPWHLENAVQEVFIKAFSTSARLSYDGIRPYRNYLFRIARNTVMDEFRKQKSDVLHIERTTALEECEQPSDDSEAVAEQRIVEQQLQARIAEFAAGLNHADRALFDVRFVKGESVETCARILHRSEYGIKRDEKRIRRQFFDRLKAHGFFEGARYRDPSVHTLIALLLSTVVRGGI